MSEEDKKESENKIEDPKISENKNPEPSPNPNKINENSEILPLNSTWTFWYASRKEKDHHIPYSDRLTKIAEFSTLQDFFKYYLYLKPVYDIERNVDIGLFKEGYKPLWECCPEWPLRGRSGQTFRPATCYV